MLGPSVIERLKRSDVDRLIVGFSGGLDSRVLLQLVHGMELPAPLTALHINHGLHEDANAWQGHCEDVCGELGIPLTALEVDVHDAGSVEENARNARYEAFESFLEAGDLLLLAHHLDDQVETLFFYLFRGNSLLGVRGMPRERVLGRGQLYRPLLDVPRQDLVRYGRQQNLTWIEDSSNNDLTPDRNYLRHRVIPAVRARWPNIDSILTQAIRRDEEARELVDSLGNIDLDAAMTGDGGVSLGALRALPRSRFKNLIRCWIRSMALPWPSESLLEEAGDALLASDEDAAPLLAWQGVELRRFRESVYLVRELPSFDRSASVEFKPGTDISVGGGQLSAELTEGRGYSTKVSGDLTVRFRQGGERIKLSRTKTLKNLFQEQGVPPWLRDRLPLIYRGEELIAVPGLPGWQVTASVAPDYEALGQDDGWIFHFNIADRPKSD